MTDAATRDDQALELRANGETFGAIAKTLGFERIHHANEAFNRALRRRPPAERESLRRQELARLDTLAEGVRTSQKLEPDEIARRLEKVERLRTMLLAD